jgi:peptide/nickel transport system substrate-binding protein
MTHSRSHDGLEGIVRSPTARITGGFEMREQSPYDGRRRGFGRGRLWLLKLATAFALVAASTGVHAAELVIAVNSPTPTFDPSIGNSVPHQRLLTAAYETLFAIDPDTNEVVPSLATSWSSNDARTSYTITLRDGVVFHDGATFDAEAVKTALERTRTIGMGESYLISAVDEIVVEGPQQVRIELSRPQPEFIYALTRMFMMSPRAIAEHQVDGDLARGWFANHAAGTGPYALSEWVEGQRYVLDRFEDYWRGWDGQHIDRLVFRVVIEPATQRLLLESGEVHVAENIVLEDLRNLERNPNVQVIRNSSPRPFYISFHTQRAPLDDVRVRRAIAYAMDYEAAIDVGLSGYGSPMRGPVPPQFPGFNDDIQEGEMNLEEARRLLTEAGYPNGGFDLTFLYLEHWVFERSVGLLLQDALGELGIGLQIEGQPWATMTARMADRDQAPDLVMYAQSTATPSALSILDPMYRSTSNHWSHFWYENPEVDRLLDAAAAEVDAATREEIYAQIQSIIVQDQPAIFTFSQDEVVTMRSNVQGYKPQLTWSKMLNYYDLYLE